MAKKTTGENKRELRPKKPFFVKRIYTGVSYQVVERTTSQVVETTENQELAEAKASQANAAAKVAALENAQAQTA